MFSNWYELNRKWKFLSQVAMFLIALFAILSFYDVVNAISFDPNVLNFIKDRILISGVFHLLIGLLFIGRFIVLFFESKNIFITSQIFWIACILSIISFHLTARFILYGAYFPFESYTVGVDNIAPIPIFLYTSNSFSLLLAFYFFVSLVRQTITLFLAYLKSK